MISEHIEMLAAILNVQGIKNAFGVVGGGASLELVLALEAYGIDYYPVAHEASAALMAGACCRDGKIRSVAISIKGPGFINLMPGVLSNFYESRSALSISEAYAPNAPLSKAHKRASHCQISSSITKGYGFLDGEGDIAASLLSLGRDEAPGPVHLDIADTPVDNDFFVNIPSQIITKLDMKVLEEILAKIKTSSRPSIILGSPAWRRLSGFDWSKVGIPVLTTAAGKGAIDERSLFSGGVITGEIKELSPESNILNKSDLIVGIGLRNTELVAATPFKAPLILVDFLGDALHEGFSPTLSLVASDIAPAVEQIWEVLSDRSWGEDDIKQFRTRLSKYLFKDKWLPANVFRHLQQVMNPETTLCLDTGLFCTIGEIVWRSTSHDTFCSSSVGRFMGTALPTSIGLAIGESRPVVCVCGDGGIRPYLPELRLAVQHRLPILIVLMTDGWYGTIASGVQTKIQKHHSFRIETPQWCEAVSSMGCSSQSVSNISGLDRAIEGWDAGCGPLFLELRFDPTLYRAMTKKLR